MLRHMFRRVSLTAIVALLAISALTRIVSASLATIPDGHDTAVDASAETLLCPPSDEVASLLSQIAQRSHALEEREAAAAMRERDVEIAREEVVASLLRLTEAEDRLAARMQQSSTASDADVARLVEVYEGMKPKEAAVLFEAMEPSFAAGFMSRMSADSASALFSNLSPEKAYALSVIMAGRNANAAKE